MRGRQEHAEEDGEHRRSIWGEVITLYVVQFGGAAKLGSRASDECLSQPGLPRPPDLTTDLLGAPEVRSASRQSSYQRG
jgi:hypothetical protein